VLDTSRSRSSSQAHLGVLATEALRRSVVCTLPLPDYGL